MSIIINSIMYIALYYICITLDTILSLLSSLTLTPTPTLAISFHLLQVRKYHPLSPIPNRNPFSRPFTNPSLTLYFTPSSHV